MTGHELNEVERRALARAIDLASSSRHINKGNPQVAAVIIDPTGKLISEGVHEGIGTDHAEVIAIENAGQHAAGATLCVSFEPCDHHGQTGPCTNAIVDAGIAKVIFGEKDRTKKTSGANALKYAGVRVTTPEQDDPLSIAAEGVVYRWQFAQIHGRPWVTLKLATSIDGHLKHPTSPGVWFTSEQSRQDVHDLRELADAVVVGTGTVLTDNPALTARNLDQSLRPAQPIRVVVGDRAIPSNARVNSAQLGQTPAVIRLARQSPEAILKELFGNSINHVLLEAGPKLAGAFVDAGLVDELIWFVAPVWFGSGDQAGRLNPADLSQIESISVAKRGADIRIHGRLLGKSQVMAA